MGCGTKTVDASQAIKCISPSNHLAVACCREAPSWAKSLILTDWVSLACMAPVIAGLVVYVVYLWQVGPALPLMFSFWPWVHGRPGE
jgi:hypothetical protein